MICCFSLKTTLISSASSLPSNTRVLANTFSASLSVSPRAAWTSFSRPSSSRLMLIRGWSLTSSMMRSSSLLKSSTDGVPNSTTATSLDSSTGIFMIGDTSTTVL